MTDPPTWQQPLPPLPEYLARLWPVVTMAEASRAWSRSRLRTLVARGTVVRILPGVYCLEGAAQDPRTKALAIVAWDPQCVVTGRAALHFYRPALPAPHAIDVLVPHGHHCSPPAWIRPHQAGVPRATGAPRGVRCTTPERALLDAWRFAAASERRDLLWQGLWERVCTWRQLAREVERAARVPDRRVLMRTLSWFAEGATSPLEVRAKHETFASAPFRDFEWQVPLAVPGRRPVADMLHRHARLVIELDGERYHAGTATEDRERDIDLAAAGYLTVRLTWRDVWRRPDWCRARVLAILAARLEALRASGE